MVDAEEHTGWQRETQLFWRLLELARYDDERDEAQGARVAAAPIEDNDVMGVVGHYNSNVTLAGAQAYCDASVPLISPIVSNLKLTEEGWSNVFR